MPLPRHLPHVIYATALTSLSLHLVGTRKVDAERRKAAEARISVLEGLASRLRAEEYTNDEEFIKAWRLSRGQRHSGEVTVKDGRELDVDWRAVALGRPTSADSEEKDEEKLRKMWDESKLINKSAFLHLQHLMFLKLSATIVKELHNLSKRHELLAVSALKAKSKELAFYTMAIVVQQPEVIAHKS